MKYKVFSVILALCVLILPITSFAAYSVEATSDSADKTESVNDYNKIHFHFNNENHYTIDDRDELTEATNDLSALSNSVSDYSRNSDNQSDVSIEMTVQFESGFMQTEEYLSFSRERSTLDCIEEIRDFRSRLNSFSKTYHSNLIQQNLNTIDDIEYDSINAIDYSPFVLLSIDAATVDVQTLEYLCQCDNIESVSLGYECEESDEASWDTTLQGSNAYDIYSNSTYTGDGIRIGVFEAKGICESTLDHLSNINITRQYQYEIVSDHATAVTSIIAQMAPDAEFYVARTSRVYYLSWFIEQGCDIVNCSFGDYNNNYNTTTQTYEYGDKYYRPEYDGVYDYQIEAHFITVVKSAGNYSTNNTKSDYNPYNEISSPGYAYNVITVGGVNTTYSNSEYHFNHAPNASYDCDSPVVKPNISAEFSVTIPNIGSKAGTSFSAPQVTAAIAWLFESNPEYCIYPDKTMALLTSTAQYTDDYSETIEYFDAKVGAGVLDAQKMIDNSDNFIEHMNSETTSTIGIVSEPIYLVAGTEIQISLAWLARTDGYVDKSGNIHYSETDVTDFDLYLTTSQGGDVIAWSSLLDSNVEMIRYTVETTGTYWIEVDLNDSIDDTDKYELLYITYSTE
ncbi:MAG: S8/S53 family peptidase [Clostridia bacterium]|nr:S8/S53 family peptidase [Clostridia bacterium]